MTIDKFKCVLCGKTVQEFGNNPAPAADSGLCCDKCNTDKVIPARLQVASGKPYMTYDQQTAALELGDKLAAFAEQYKLTDVWIRAMMKQAKASAMDTTGIDIAEA